MSGVPPLLKAPLSPQDRLRRLLRVAKVDGLSVLIVAGGFGLLSAAFGDLSGAGVGLVIALAGAIELWGVSLLRSGSLGGLRWLVGSQAYLLAMIFAYAAWRLANLAHDPIVRAINRAILTAGADPELLPFDAHQIMKATYVLLVLVTLLYQGGMIVYYARRRTAVAQALKAPLN
ncbi:MAG TPA: hypothetical protein VGF85_09945 [Opitutaceae bacterium]|jgi:hypothetical protein